MTGRKSFNRGIAIMKLLATNGSMTASAIARELDIDQSSASRLMKSLILAGFVYKPSFQQFALDYGILAFAGIALDHFPLTTDGGKCCNSIHDKYGCGATVGVLHEEHLLYMAFITENTDSRLKVINDVDFPVHTSSLGLLLSYIKGKEYFHKIVSASLKRLNDNRTSDELYDFVHDSINNSDVLYMPSFGINKFNAAIPFEYKGQMAALAIFSEKKNFSVAKCEKILNDGLNLIGDDITHYKVIK